MNEHFSRMEFECHCGCGFASVDAELLEVLTKIREHFDSPVNITSGNRCKIYNIKIGGAPKSKHTKGLAADIKVASATPQRVVAYLNETYPNRYGFIEYSTWTHIDVRSEPYRAKAEK